MPTCVFFGHRTVPQKVRSQLEKTVIKLIELGVDCFYVGHNGAFDQIALEVLKSLAERYPIQYGVVVEKMGQLIGEKWENTVFPEGLETVPPRFAIWYRNRWMVQQADYVVAYVNGGFGGAAQFLAYAERQKKRIINLAVDDLK